MKNGIRVIAGISLLGLAAFIIPGQANAAVPAASQTVAWLKSVQKIENVVIKVGKDLEKVGTAKTNAQGLVSVRQAEKDNKTAISLFKAEPKVPSKYAGVDKLLGKSLQEYKSGLATVDKGFVKNSSPIIKQGLAVIKKGTADQNKVASMIKQISKT